MIFFFFLTDPVAYSQIISTILTILIRFALQAGRSYFDYKSRSIHSEPLHNTNVYIMHLPVYTFILTRQALLIHTVNLGDTSTFGAVQSDYPIYFIVLDENLFLSKPFNKAGFKILHRFLLKTFILELTSLH